MNSGEKKHKKGIWKKKSTTSTITTTTYFVLIDLQYCRGKRCYHQLPYLYYHKYRLTERRTNIDHKETSTRNK